MLSSPRTLWRRPRSTDGGGFSFSPPRWRRITRPTVLIAGTLLALFACDTAQACRWCRGRLWRVTPAPCMVVTCPAVAWCQPWPSCDEIGDACGGCDVSCGSADVYFPAVSADDSATHDQSPAPTNTAPGAAAAREPAGAGAAPAAETPRLEPPPAEKSVLSQPSEQPAEPVVPPTDSPPAEPAGNAQSTVPAVPDTVTPAPGQDDSQQPAVDAAPPTPTTPAGTPAELPTVPPAEVAPAPADTTPAPAGNLDDLFKEPGTAPAPGATEKPAGGADETLNDLFGNGPPSGRPASPAPAGGLASQQLRGWTDNSGRYACQGRLVRVLDGKVQILKANGRISTVPLSRLSGADVQFVRSEALATARRALVAQMVNSQAATTAPAIGNGR